MTDHIQTQSAEVTNEPRGRKVRNNKSNNKITSPLRTDLVVAPPAKKLYKLASGERVTRSQKRKRATKAKPMLEVALKNTSPVEQKEMESEEALALRNKNIGMMIAIDETTAHKEKERRAKLAKERAIREMRKREKDISLAIRSASLYQVKREASFVSSTTKGDDITIKPVLKKTETLEARRERLWRTSKRVIVELPSKKTVLIVVGRRNNVKAYLQGCARAGLGEFRSDDRLYGTPNILYSILQAARDDWADTVVMHGRGANWPCLEGITMRTNVSLDTNGKKYWKHSYANVTGKYLGPPKPSPPPSLGLRPKESVEELATIAPIELTPAAVSSLPTYEDDMVIVGPIIVNSNVGSTTVKDNADVSRA